MTLVGVLPPTLAVLCERAMVGRERELAIIQRAWDDVRARGVRRTVVLAGEPGIGKTRLAAEAASLAAAEGATVLFGRSEEGLHAPYQPFAEALRSLVRSMPDDVLAGDVGDDGGHLVHLVPELRDRLPRVLRSEATDPDVSRYALFESVTSLVSAVSQRGPLVLVLDDVHWASAATIALWRHVMRASQPMALLVVSTFRDSEADATHPVSSLLVDLHRDGVVERCGLGGLDVTAVAELVGPSSADEVHRATAGNPFFVTELARHDGGVPDSVREVVDQRIRRIADASVRVLRTMAVLGTDVAVDDVIAVEDDVDAVLDAIDELVAAKLVVDPGVGGRVAFAHRIVRETVLAGVSMTRRGRLHARVAAVLSPTRVEEVAHHHLEAAAGGAPNDAPTWALAAARGRLDRLAFEDAVDIARRGLATLDLLLGDGALRVDLLLVVADALDRMQDGAGALAAALEAADVADRIGAAERLAAAALLVATPTGIVMGAANPTVDRVCRRALAALGDAHPELRVRVLARLSIQRAYGDGDLDAALPLADEALSLARAAGDHTGLAHALAARDAALQTTPDLVARLSGLDELLVAAEASDDLRRVVEGHYLRARVRLQIGDIAAFLDDVAVLEALGAERRSWTAAAYAAVYRSGFALYTGDLDAVEGLAALILEHAGHDPDMVNTWASQLLVLRREQGRLAEVLPVLSDAAAANLGLPIFRAGLAALAAEMGDLDEAARQLQPLMADGCAALRRDFTFTGSLAFLVEAAGVLGDAESLRVLGDLLAPHAGSLVVVGGTSVCLGAVDRFLAIAAGGDTALFDAALALEERTGGTTAVARTQHWRSACT